MADDDNPHCRGSDDEGNENEEDLLPVIGGDEEDLGPVIVANERDEAPSQEQESVKREAEGSGGIDGEGPG